MMKGQPTTLAGWIHYYARTWIMLWQSAEISHTTAYRQPGGRADW